MNCLIISDSHGDRNSIIEVLKRTAKVDMVIHLGDICGDERFLLDNAGCTVHMIAGNNDYYSDLDKEKEIVLCGKKVFLTHGHRYGIDYSLDSLAQEAKVRQADIVMFGHIHIPVIEKCDGITMVNPGSLAYPRQSGFKRSFMMLDIDSEKKFHFSIDYL